MRYIQFVIVAMVFIGCSENSNEDSQTQLPYIGIHDYPTHQNADGETLVDTVYHRVPDWAFMNQDSVMVGRDDYAGHIYISDFFFANCPVICPLKTDRLMAIQEELEKEGLTDQVKIISHTVDPTNDSIPALKKYTEDRDIDTGNWDFVFGEKEIVYDLAMKGYLISVAEDPMAEGGILHTDAFILVDWDGHLRGVYDGTSTEENQRLLKEIKILLKEKKND